VKAGQQIVTEGVVKLTDGAPVRLAGDKKGEDDKDGKPAKAAG
jgi:membrane fusion protein, multidrug efflux system